MGAYGSSRIISRQEACNLLGPSGTRRIEEGFSRLAALNAVSHTSVGGSISPPIPGGGGGPRGSGPGGGTAAAVGVDRRTFQRFVLDAFPVMVSMMLLHTINDDVVGALYIIHSSRVHAYIHNSPRWSRIACSRPLIGRVRDKV